MMIGMPGERSRFVLPVANLDFTRRWEVGAVRLHPAGTASTLVAASRETAPLKDTGWVREWVDQQAAELDRSAVAEVQAADIEEAMRQVTDALAVLRVVQRLRYPVVNVRSQTFGLPGQITRATLEYLDITVTPAVGGRHVGAGTGWTFRDADHDAWMREPPFRFLHEALTRSDQDRTSLQRRALIAIDLFSQALLSWQPDTALLLWVMALEVLLGDQADRAKKFRVARRVSYFLCGWPNHRYSDGRPACPYLTHPLSRRGQPGPDLQRLIKAVEAGSAPRMYCSQFFDVLGLFDARNDIAHEGRLGLTPSQERQATWFLSGSLLTLVLTWFAEHPDSELMELDAEIAALPRMDAAVSD